MTKAGWSAAAALAVALSAPWTTEAQVSVTTYHNDIARTGQNTQETVLNPANVNVNQFGKVFTVPVDSSVFAQPLYVPAVTIATGTVNGTFNVLYVATEHDSVYAIDADSGTVYWQVNLIPAGGRTVVGDPDIAAGCDDTLPEIGITGTPVIDPVAGVLYVVSKAIVAGAAVQSLHALDLGSGAESLGGPVAIQASVVGSGYDAAGGIVTFNPLFENQRAALLLENGHVIIAWTSHCDVDPWHGWVISYNAGTLVQEAVFNTTPNGQEGGVWMSGGGIAADAGGNLYLATGNGTWDGAADYSESILKLAPPSAGGFAVLDYFTPSDQAFLTAGDTDVASGGPVLLPALNPSGQQLLALMGKLGTIYVVDRNNLGKYCPNVSATCGAADPQIVQEVVGASYGVWGAPAYWNGNLYWGAVNDYLKAFSFDTGSGQVSSAATSKSPQIFGFPGPTPSVSANGATAGIVWGLDATAYGSTCVGGANCQVLYAYDATNLGTMLYNSSQADGDRDVPGGAVKFAVPTIANGKVYVGSQNAVSAFGELTNAPASATGPSLSPPAGAYTSAQSVALSDTTPGAVIYYTTDGTTPTTSSAIYAAPFTIESTGPVQAIATAAGYVQSAVSGGVYIINSAGGTTPEGIDLTEAFNSSNISAIVVDGAFTTNGGIDGHGNALSANLLGTTVTWNGATYAIGIPGQPDGVNGATIAIPPGNFTTITLLAAAVNGNQPDQQFVLNYYDGTSTIDTQSISDWHAPQGYAGEATAVTMVYRLASTGNQQTTKQTGPYYLYGYSFAIPGGETVESLQLPVNANVVVLAIDVTPASTGTGAATPAFVPAAGTYPTAQTVTLSDTTTGASIYYTTDGSTPTSASTLYTGSITVSATMTLNAIAVATGYTTSPVATGTYTIGAPPVAVSLGGIANLYGLADTGTAVTGGGVDGFGNAYAESLLGAAVTYAGVTFTLAAPGPGSAVTSTTIPLAADYDSAITLLASAVNGAQVNQAFVVTYADGSTQTFTQSLSDWFLPAYYSGETIAATMAYRISPAGVEDAGPVYLYAYSFALNSGKKVQSISLPNNANVIVVAIDVTVAAPAESAAAAPTFSPIAGTYSTDQTVTLGDTTPNAVIHYTTDGSPPTLASTLYTAPLPIGVSTTIKAIATASGYATGPVATAAYTIELPLAATPTFSPAAGSFDAVQSVALADATPHASMYYTVDGSTPTLGSTHYTGAIPVDASMTIKAIAVASDYTPSAIASAAYVIALPQPATAAPVLNPAPGRFDAAVLVVLTDATPHAVIHYTLDGSTPSATSPTYSAALAIDTTTTINAIAIAAGYTDSAFAGGTYVIGTMPPPAVAAAPTFEPLPGTFAAVQNVSISDATPGAAIYYTSNGSTPTTASTQYTGPISVTATTTLKAIATASDYSTSSVAGGTYAINLPAADTPTLSPASTTFTSSQTVTLADTTPGAAIHYTTDGSTPDASSPTYGTPLALTATTTVHAIAIAPNYVDSPVASGTYTLTAAPATKSGGGGALGLQLLGGLALLLALRPRRERLAP